MSLQHPGVTPNQMVNLRDVGAPGSAMSRWVRPGVLWRSDAPHPGDAEEPVVETLGDGSWPPRVVIDLRDPKELRDQPHPLTGRGVEIVALPLAGSLAPAEQLRMREGRTSLGELYLQLLGTAPRWLPVLVARAAQADGPTLVHCAAGKDRTGVAVALLLTLAGVPRSEIVADYLATRDALPNLRPRLGLDGTDLAAIEHLLDVSIPAMTAVLDHVGPDPVAFHRENGVAPEDIERWQQRLRR
ncbi:tyrosine-protein phosphatase [Actinomycetospora endophytica]|uniref:Tyrosine-protein phosphatase n=1 Tax=Actinomycetospora endophytica TaxID=2291215 RepID=A0ABS8PE46_9PSEU|nr:tyrosine-protein phosphatase [Actinomycetospora endophytica]MCD2196258.1 tyrosine-protein phosphatase [Actinomycetospora endophytica]